MRDFRSGKVTTLLATDVAGRGLHISRCRHHLSSSPCDLDELVRACSCASGLR